MILNNNISLMDEDFFNFQLEMADLQTYHSIQSSALEITTESESIFTKIKNAIVKFFRKIIDFIKGFFRKDSKKAKDKDNENKDAASEANNKKKDLTFPINVSGEDNIIYDMERDEDEATKEINQAIDCLQTFRDIVNNGQNIKKEQLMRFVNINITDPLGVGILDPNFSTVVKEWKKELDDIVNEIQEDAKSSKNIIKLTPGGEISSQQELDKIINLSKDTKFEKIISFNERNVNIIEKLSSEIERKVQRLNVSDPKIVKIINNSFSITNVSVNFLIKILNLQKNIVKRNVDTINSVLNQVNG